MAGVIDWIGSTWAERDAKAAARLSQARREESRNRRLVKVRRVDRVAHNGTMAWIQFDGSGDVMDAWFWNTRISRGQIAVVDGSVGRGTRSRDVYYISTVAYVLPRNTYRLARRHERRVRRQVGG